MVLFFIPVKRMRNLMINFQFFRLNLSAFSQLWFWLNFVSVVGILFAFHDPMTSYLSLAINILAMISRASNIAAKYATFPAKQMCKYRDQVLTVKEIQGDFLLGNWAAQKPEIIETETMNAIQRNGFDMSVFRMSFLAKVSEKLDKRMEEIHMDLALSPDPKTSVMLQCTKLKDYYWGVHIFYVMVDYFNKTKKTRFFAFRALVITLLAGFAPFWAKIIVGLPLKSTVSDADTAVFYLNLFPTPLLFFFTMLFFNQARIDIDRTTFIMHQLTHLISTQKKSNEIIKILPTLNFLEELSMNSWKILRRITLDYGKKYFYRHELYMPVVFVIALACYLLVFVLQYGIMHFPYLFIDRIYIVELQVGLGIMALVMFYMSFDLLLAFASINEFFEKHTLKLYNVKTTLGDLRKYKSHFFKKYLKGDTVDNSCKVLKEVLYLQSLSHIHSRLAHEISELFGDQLCAQLDGFFNQTYLSLDSIIEEIAIDQQYQNIKILGFVITKSFVGNLLVLLGSVTLAFVQLVLLQ